MDMSERERSLRWLYAAENSIDDAELFESLDPGWPGLEPTMAAYRAGELEQAKTELMNYFYKRQTPRWFIDYRDQPVQPVELDGTQFVWGAASLSPEQLRKALMGEAERMCRETEAGRPLQAPLFHMGGKDDKPLRRAAHSFSRLTFLNALAFAYHETAEPRYVETYVRVLEQLAELLLERYPYAPDRPSSEREYTLQFSKSPMRNNMNLARSALNLIHSMYTGLFFSPLVPLSLRFRWFRYLWYIMLHHRSYDRNVYRHHNHHLFERGVAPLIFGTMFPEFSVLRPLQQRGQEVIWQHLEQDFHPSGGYDEHSLSYACHTTLTEFLLPVKLLSERNELSGFGVEWDQKLKRSYTFYSQLVLPDGTFPDIGDHGGGKALTFIEQGIRYYGCSSLRAVRDGLGLRSSVSAEPSVRESIREGALKLPLTVCDAATGYLCTRESWSAQSNCMVMSNKVFTFPCSHNHIDMLSLIVAVHGETVIGEPQARDMYKFVSNNSELDDYMRGLGSHNTVLLHGRPLTKRDLRADRMKLWSCETEQLSEWEDRLYVRASHQAYRNARHTREVMFVREQGWRIRDEVTMTAAAEEATQPHVQRWHLAKGISVEAAGERALLLSGSKSRLLCIWGGGERGISFRLWRNEAVLAVNSLGMYRNVEDLPWIIDVLFPGDGTNGSGQVECVWLDLSASSAPLADYLAFGNELLTEGTEVKATRRLRLLPSDTV